MTTAGGNVSCKTCGSEMHGANGESVCGACGRKDCTVTLNCINVKAVPVSLRGGIAPIHRALLEIIEESGEDGQIGIPKMMEELQKRGFGGLKNG